jgi:6-phosphofructokinase 1
VIAGIVDRHNLYAHPTDPKRPAYPLAIHGYLNGFRSLAQQGVRHDDICMRLDQEPLKSKIKEDATRGGSLLGTSRLDALLSADDPEKREETFSTMIENLRGIDILYVIGGDGSMRVAHALQVAHDRQRDHDSKNRNELTVVGIPKTMDNDVLWVWQSFGFLSAVEKAKEFITQLRTEAESNPRLCVMQLFGSDSGFVVSHAAVASGVVDLALIPEIPFSMAKVSEYITDKLKAMKESPNHRRSPHGLVLMAETAIPTDVLKFVEEDEKLPNDKKILRLEREEREEIARYLANDRRVRGQTPDALRTGGLKIVSRVLQNEIKNLQEFPGDYWSDFRVFTNEPRHLLRSLEPSSSDIIFGHRLGCLAVDNAMAGFTDFMVSQWLTEFVLVPLPLVVLGRKRVPRDGIFWRSVLDSTGQPANLTKDSEPTS